MKKKWIFSLLASLLVIALLAYFLFPFNHASAEDYFMPIGERQLQKDEIGQSYVKEDPESGPSPLATMTGMMAAKEFGDVELWGKLRNSIDRNMYQKRDSYQYVYKDMNNAIYNAPILWTKVHVGWQKILDFDWTGNHTYEKPDVANLVWTDILSQELLLMDDVLN